MSRDEIVTDMNIVEAVTDALKRQGVYSKLKANIRAEVFNLLDDKTVEMPPPPRDVFLASELIREFLMIFKCNNTLSVFIEEMGGGPMEMYVDRPLLGHELGLNTLNCDEKVPLLVMLVEYLKANRVEYIRNKDDSMIVEGAVNVSLTTDTDKH